MMGLSAVVSDYSQNMNRIRMYFELKVKTIISQWLLLERDQLIKNGTMNEREVDLFWEINRKRDNLKYFFLQIENYVVS